jgi:hypothetical protein
MLKVGKTKYEGLNVSASWFDFLGLVWTQIYRMHVPAYVKPSYWN